MKKREPTLSEIANIAKLSANEETVLVGGMAVSVLAAYFHTPSDIPLYTKDADLVELTIWRFILPSEMPLVLDRQKSW